MAVILFLFRFTRVLSQVDGIFKVQFLGKRHGAGVGRLVACAPSKSALLGTE